MSPRLVDLLALLAIPDFLVLVWIAVQGQVVWFYERETYKMARERYKERTRWREQKRQQLLKKESEQKTEGSSTSTTSPLPIEINAPPTKITNAKSVVAPLTSSDLVA